MQTGVRAGIPERSTNYLRRLFGGVLTMAQLAGRLTTQSAIQLREARCREATLPESHSVLFASGEREKVLQFLRDWFEQDVHDYLNTCYCSLVRRTWGILTTASHCQSGL